MNGVVSKVNARGQGGRGSEHGTDAEVAELLRTHSFLFIARVWDGEGPHRTRRMRPGVLRPYNKLVSRSLCVGECRS